MADKQPEKSKFDLVKEAQAEQQEILNLTRIQLIEALADLESIGGTDGIKNSVLKLVEGTAGRFPGGIPFPFVQKAIGTVELGAVIKALVEEKKIKKEGKKGNYVLQLASN